MATIDVLASEKSVAQPSGSPQFEHSFHPWFFLTLVAITALMLVAFFVYGQIAPGS